MVFLFGGGTAPTVTRAEVCGQLVLLGWRPSSTAAGDLKFLPPTGKDLGTEVERGHPLKPGFRVSEFAAAVGSHSIAWHYCRGGPTISGPLLVAQDVAVQFLASLGWTRRSSEGSWVEYQLQQ